LQPHAPPRGVLFWLSVFALSVGLQAQGAWTLAFDLVRLTTAAGADGDTSVEFKSPGSAREAPPGWWMMFLVTSSGRPSQAYWVHLQ
jgi:hypothetical protein